MNYNELHTENRDAAFGEMRGSRPHHAIFFQGKVVELFLSTQKREAIDKVRALSRLGPRRTVRYLEEDAVYELHGADGRLRVHGTNDGHHTLNKRPLK